MYYYNDIMELTSICSRHVKLSFRKENREIVLWFGESGAGIVELNLAEKESRE